MNMILFNQVMLCLFSSLSVPHPFFMFLQDIKPRMRLFIMGSCAFLIKSQGPLGQRWVLWLYLQASCLTSLWDLLSSCNTLVHTHTHTHTNKQTNKQTNKHTHTHTTHTHTSMAPVPPGIRFLTSFNRDQWWVCLFYKSSFAACSGLMISRPKSAHAKLCRFP